MRPRRSSKRAKTKTKTKSLVNWLNLPPDVMIQIFMKIGTIELLYNAQRVCSSWRAIAKDPQLYRAVDLRDPWKYFDHDGFDKVEKMARQAIDRSSCGQLVEFSIEYFCTDAILYQLMHKSPRLKCLRLANCGHGFGDEEGLIEVLENLPLLEEVEFVLPFFSMDVIEAVGRSCLNLKSFRMNGCGIKIMPGDAMEEVVNVEAFAIAANLNPGLGSLHLLGDSMNNDGLEVVLGRFTQLEYLDLRRCANLDLKGDLLKKCQGIKTLRLPNDSIEDYQFVVGERNDWMVSRNVESDYEDGFGWGWGF